MTVLIINNHKTDDSHLKIAASLKKYDCPYVEMDGLEAGFNLLTEKEGAFSVIIVNSALIMAQKDLAKKDALKDIPLILTLGPDEEESIKPFKHTAPYQWLQNIYSDNALYSMVLSAKNEFSQRRALRREIHSRASVIGAITRGTFRIRTFEQAEALTTMLSLACPDPSRIAFGLFELLANGIEHGNLGITHEDKSRLMAENTHRQEIARRLELPEYKDRYVEVTFEREANLVSLKIEDQGAGFDYHQYKDCELSPNNNHHGRGIALARATSFDYLEFLDKGNKVLAITKFAP